MKHSKLNVQSIFLMLNKNCTKRESRILCVSEKNSAFVLYNLSNRTCSCHRIENNNNNSYTTSSVCSWGFYNIDDGDFAFVKNKNLYTSYGNGVSESVINESKVPDRTTSIFKAMNLIQMIALPGNILLGYTDNQQFIIYTPK